ncbi:MAG: S-adenosylmethionine:tRNA ribosyltransferase-isomerase [Bdellovibrionales bacterium RIFCSPHIGHO2_01_FULL_40_29]|nr:MAG: S-adenosylmethionine:tRNA ribosyltransferase-isomerase [Bdellovibrionales bacterium RIFCSPHIGHO2_01_FULL_40_29]OFZ34432.1 MAG: S-adenosylmethionine:tRNA ribosyltransferase-isomerase [Bdellovibrionales bacterium RIFCSPHIGHO2_02_FULL_40_15]
MKRSELNYDYPESLIATEPSRPSRVMYVDGRRPAEQLTIPELIAKIPQGDVFVINNTQVLKRRVFAKELEILFLDQLESNTPSANTWSVLFPSKKFSIGDQIELPQGFKMTLLEKGRPQKVSVRPAINQSDFDQIAELPLPPYIQRARGDRHNITADDSWYQTAWAVKPGSFAAPTASLHFSETDIQTLRNQGVLVIDLTLHVGLGTFLPVLTEDLSDHKMHEEIYELNEDAWNQIQKAVLEKRGIWSLGTTTTRVLESVARTGKLSGSTDILLQVGSDFKIVNRLLTNFHQPESTLLALVAGFAGLEVVKHNYSWAVDRGFKLFSYGDLSVWIKP